MAADLKGDEDRFPNEKPVELAAQAAELLVRTLWK